MGSGDKERKGLSERWCWDSGAHGKGLNLQPNHNHEPHTAKDKEGSELKIWFQEGKN